MIKKLSKKFPPSDVISMKVGRNDMLVHTDEDGNAVLLFMGKIGSDGMIKGDRYARTLKYDREGKLIKDHWERKGKAS